MSNYRIGTWIQGVAIVALVASCGRPDIEQRPGPAPLPEDRSAEARVAEPAADDAVAAGEIDAAAELAIEVEVSEDEFQAEKEAGQAVIREEVLAAMIANALNAHRERDTAPVAADQPLAWPSDGDQRPAEEVLAPMFAERHRAPASAPVPAEPAEPAESAVAATNGEATETTASDAAAVVAATPAVAAPSQRQQYLESIATAKDEMGHKIENMLPRSAPDFMKRELTRNSHELLDCPAECTDEAQKLLTASYGISRFLAARGFKLRTQGEMIRGAVSAGTRLITDIAMIVMEARAENPDPSVIISLVDIFINDLKDLILSFI